MDINSILTYRESWPISTSLGVDELYKELRRVDLFDQIICAYYLRVREEWERWGGRFRLITKHRPLFLSVEAEDAAMSAYLQQALPRYTRTDEEDPEADCNKFAQEFGIEIPDLGERLVDYHPMGRILMRQCLIVRSWGFRHEEFLRKREAQLQQGKIRALHILDLPMDILAYVFDEFQHQPKSGAVDWAREQHKAQDRKPRLETIRSARLVCHVFNKLATPLLCPILHLSISQQSIDRVQKIIGNPLISSGVRGVRLALSHCLSEIATDESRFLRLVRREVEDVHHYCCQVFGTFKDINDPRNVSAQNGFQMLMRALETYGETAPAEWALLTPPRLAGVTRYVEALRRGLQGYRDLHHEQAGLLRDGVFTSTLASLLARLQKPIALNLFFNDAQRLPKGDPNGSIKVTPEMKRTPEIFVNPDSLTECIRKPHSSHFGGQTEFESAKFICELPIALQKQGVLVTQFSLSDMTRARSFAPLDPRTYRSAFGLPTDWASLSSFSENFESINLSSSGRSSLTNVEQADVPTIENYLRAMLSSSRLVDVHITLAFLMTSGPLPQGPPQAFPQAVPQVVPQAIPPGLPPGLPQDFPEDFPPDFPQDFFPDFLQSVPQVMSTPREDFYQIQSSIFTSPWPRIRKVSIECLAIPEVELQRFCQNLGDEMAYFFMGNIKLTSGSWGNILSILRSKLAARIQMKKCTVWIRMLRGGEADQVASHSIGQLAQMYVSGGNTKTPWEITEEDLTDLTSLEDNFDSFLFL
ncbi:unnamed protein product [Clonostachys rosea]|uniref:F-box domain-containing protein n=1 Tax=Bionectria ochroleuca TaxID=29856 RepID=A0ABY6UZ69_BIOOC|nr:unnamed protein product [Clonostachys rosea]